MNATERVVFDCNIYFQALISPTGPAGQAFDAAAEGRCILLTSEFVLDELRDITSRPKIAARFKITSARVAVFLESIEEIATIVSVVPAIFDFPRDPQDAHYVDLAIAAKAKLIVSRDLDLLSLGNLATLEGRDFRSRFPDLQILTPTELLDLLNQM
jgi:putative PIN family toxin of toxin-antitoxin system